MKLVQCNLSSRSCPETCVHKKPHEPIEEEYIFDSKVQRAFCTRASGCTEKGAIVRCIKQY